MSFVPLEKFSFVSGAGGGGNSSQRGEKSAHRGWRRWGGGGGGGISAGAGRVGAKGLLRERRSQHRVHDVDGAGRQAASLKGLLEK